MLLLPPPFAPWGPLVPPPPRSRPMDWAWAEGSLGGMSSCTPSCLNMVANTGCQGTLSGELDSFVKK